MMENKKPFNVRISTGCILYIMVMIFIFWFGIRMINRCTEPEYHTLPAKNVQCDTIIVHDTIYVDETPD